MVVDEVHGRSVEAACDERELACIVAEFGDPESLAEAYAPWLVIADAASALILTAACERIGAQLVVLDTNELGERVLDRAIETACTP
jgi:hypothetical protein